MFKKFDGIIVDEVICYEETVKMKLPKDYKEFLLDTNGGQFIDEIHTFWVDELKENIGIDVLFGFNQVRSLCLNSWYNEYGEELPEQNINVEIKKKDSIIYLTSVVEKKVEVPKYIRVREMPSVKENKTSCTDILKKLKQSEKRNLSRN